MILYLVAAFVFGTVFGVLVSALFRVAFSKKPKSCDLDTQSVTKCFIDILKH